MYTFDLRYPQRKKSHGFKSGEWMDQLMSPRNEIKWPGNISLKIPIARWKVWAVAQSCWNQALSVLWSIFNFGLRIVFSISQYRSEFTVTVRSSSKKYGPHIPNSATARHTVTWGQCKGRSCNSRGLFSNLKFCLFTVPHRWKCASSLNNTAVAWRTCWWISKHNALRVSMSLFQSSFDNIILYEYIFRSLWRILRKLLLESLRAWAHSNAERLYETKWHYMYFSKLENTFLFLHFIWILLNLQMCQIILPDPV